MTYGEGASDFHFTSCRLRVLERREESRILEEE